MKYLAKVRYKDNEGENKVEYNVAGYPSTNFEGKAYWMFMTWFYNDSIKKKSIKIELL